ncbi:MAG: hypothetical protein WCT85_06495 [Parachlamydiales bacterium]|jgi:hypothetical protein
MKKYSLYLVLALSVFSILPELDANATRLEVQVGDPYYEDDIVWGGPGWYYGVWFNSEIEYVQWRRHNHRYHRRYYRGYRDNHWRSRDHHGRHH